MLSLSATAFPDQGPIPRRMTCEGADEPPELHFELDREGAASLALIVDDPDAPDPRAPTRTFVHLVVYNIPPSTTTLFPGGTRVMPAPTRLGKNDWGRLGWRGPCPPVGRHRYFFTLYALDVVLPDLKSPTKAKLLGAMSGHVLEQATLMGTYELQEERHPRP